MMKVFSLRQVYNSTFFFLGKKEIVYTNASKQVLIFSPPPVLTLHLKRFQQVGQMNNIVVLCGINLSFQSVDKQAVSFVNHRWDFH